MNALFEIEEIQKSKKTIIKDIPDKQMAKWECDETFVLFLWELYEERKKIFLFKRIVSKGIYYYSITESNNNSYLLSVTYDDIHFLQYHFSKNGWKTEIIKDRFLSTLLIRYKNEK